MHFENIAESINIKAFSITVSTLNSHFKFVNLKCDRKTFRYSN